MVKQQQEFQLHELDGGLRLVTVPMAGVGSVTVMVLVGVGSRYETLSQAGISHFCEHLLLDGTKRYPTSKNIAVAIDGVGGDHNAFTSKDYTAYYVKVASEHLELALDVLSDVVLEPRLTEQDIAKEKQVIAEEINMREDNHRLKAAEYYDALLYGSNGLGRETIGTKKTVKGLSRQDFVDFVRLWYGGKNMVVVVAGDAGKIKDSRQRGGQARFKIQKIVGKYFSKGGTKRGGGKPSLGTLAVQTRPRVRVAKRKTEQAHFYLGVPGLARLDDDRYALSVLTTALGGNSSARLFQEIREKRGLAYYAYASASSYTETGTLYAFAGVDPKRVDEAIRLTLEQFRLLARGKGQSLQKDEVVRAREYLRGKVVLDWEDSEEVALLYGKRLLLTGEIETQSQVLERIAGVTHDQVAAVGERLWRPELVNLAVVGNFADAGRFEKLVGKRV